MSWRLAEMEYVNPSHPMRRELLGAVAEEHLKGMSTRWSNW